MRNCSGRVDMYRVITTYANGVTHNREDSFTQAQADQVGAVLDNGIHVRYAIKLIDMWNRQGSSGPIKHQYNIILK